MNEIWFCNKTSFKIDRICFCCKFYNKKRELTRTMKSFMYPCEIALFFDKKKRKNRRDMLFVYKKLGVS